MGMSSAAAAASALTWEEIRVTESAMKKKRENNFFGGAMGTHKICFAANKTNYAQRQLNQNHSLCLLIFINNAPQLSYIIIFIIIIPLSQAKQPMKQIYLTFFFIFYILNFFKIFHCLTGNPQELEIETRN